MNFINFRVSFICTSLVLLVNFSVSAQTFEIAPTFTTSDAPFYKNVPGLSLGYAYHLKHQFILVEVCASKRENSYSQIESDWISDGYEMQKADGTFSTFSYKLGLAQKLITTDNFSISLGIDISGNFYKREENYVFFLVDMYGLNLTGNDTRHEIFNNKFGMGAFLDLEIKHVVFNNLSLFSKFAIERTQYETALTRDDSHFHYFYLRNIIFSFGTKISIP